MSQDHPLLLGDHASRWLGIKVDRVGEGHAQIRMTLREEMLNGFGMAHGGMIFAFADTCFALACNSPSGSDGTITVAAGADINFISSAREGQTLVAKGTVRAQAGRSGVYDIQVTADDALVAEFRGRSRTIPKPRQKPALSHQSPAHDAAVPTQSSSPSAQHPKEARL
ncbi:phenylacetic acid degradation protein PaaD [Arthrobacter agilis]|nr:hydroxyphenylacetyl-CoA thioesterase PaaI [Arthrobacter sedimenti]OUM41979.1 phenylacetic acid degradation protein PaaD [Arthrobacter agilis]